MGGFDSYIGFRFLIAVVLAGIYLALLVGGVLRLAGVVLWLKKNYGERRAHAIFLKLLLLSILRIRLLRPTGPLLKVGALVALNAVLYYLVLTVGY